MAALGRLLFLLAAVAFATVPSSSAQSAPTEPQTPASGGAQNEQHISTQDYINGLIVNLTTGARQGAAPAGQRTAVISNMNTLNGNGGAGFGIPPGTESISDRFQRSAEQSLKERREFSQKEHQEQFMKVKEDQSKKQLELQHERLRKQQRREDESETQLEISEDNEKASERNKKADTEAKGKHKVKTLAEQTREHFKKQRIEMHGKQKLENLQKYDAEKRAKRRIMQTKLKGQQQRDAVDERMFKDRSAEFHHKMQRQLKEDNLKSDMQASETRAKRERKLKEAGTKSRERTQKDQIQQSIERNSKEGHAKLESKEQHALNSDAQFNGAVNAAENQRNQAAHQQTMQLRDNLRNEDAAKQNQFHQQRDESAQKSADFQRRNEEAGKQNERQAKAPVGGGGAAAGRR